jgi:phosphoribosylaminoimidazolecarboxamide formyltransferase / IMP cyclohydrolase
MASMHDQASAESAFAASGGEGPQATTMEGVQAASAGDSRVRRALISVSDKTGVVDLARGLQELGVEIVSTGGTARALSEAGVQVRAIEDFTGFPEMMDGRVKTLHPRLYAGLLARRDDESHIAEAAEQRIEQVDLVCVNLYPFEQTVASEQATDAEAIENIDIGGPTMIRAAAKNHDYAAVLVDPADYQQVLSELRASDGRLSVATRRELAAAAFALTARYDAAISAWFAARQTAAWARTGHAEDGAPQGEEGAPVPLPSRRTLTYEKALDLRYGENPHQRGAYYVEVGAPSHLLSGVKQLHGKELSFNNLLDLGAARELAFDFDRPACAIVKHNNPCGCALGQSALASYQLAFACDPQSAFGGVIALNRKVDKTAAEAIAQQFVEVLLAPGFDEDALQVLRQSKNVRLLELALDAHALEGGTAKASSCEAQSGGSSAERTLEARPVQGGLLVQDRDHVGEARAQMRQMSNREPQEREWQDMLFAWQVCMRVRSNAIVIARDCATIGIGAGQMSRVDAVRIAVEKASEMQPQKLAGSALASDAYFPFPDGPQLGIDAGVSAIVQPGGSIRDELSVQAANAADVAMVATGIRHFKH